MLVLAPWVAALVLAAAPTEAAAEPARAEASRTEAGRGDPGRTIPLDERSPLLTFVITPAGAEPGVPTADLYRAADRVLRARTTLAVASPEQSGVDLAQLTACELRVRLSCWVKLVRNSAPAYLFVVSSLPLADRRDKLGGILIDVELATRTIDEASLDAATQGAEQQLEDELYREAVETEPAVIAHGDQAAVERWLATLVDRELRPSFEATKRFDGHGAIELRGAPSGLAIELDGRALGATGEGGATISGLLAGRRHVVLTDPARRFASLAIDVVVRARETAVLEPALVPLPAASHVGPRQLTLYGGLALAGAGAVLTTWAVASAPSARAVSACTGPGCAADRSSALATFCELGSDDPAACGGGVLAAPLGYGLVLAGGVSAIGAYLSDRDDAFPWLSIVLGVAAGGVAYGASALAR